MRKDGTATASSTAAISAPLSVAVTGLRGIPGIMGGIETHCEELLPRLSALDRSVHITVLGRAPYLPRGIARFGDVAVVPLPAPRRTSIEAIISTFVSVLYARAKGFRLLHIHAVGPGMLAPLARLLGMQVIVTHHGADYDRAKWGPFARMILRLGERASAAAAHRIICVSPSLCETLATRYPASRDRLRYIPNGAPELGDGERNAAEILTEMGLEAGGYTLAVGRLVPEKGFDYLIEAHRRSGCRRVLAIVGAADHNSSFSRKLMASAGDHVRFLGLQPRTTLRPLYENAGLFVLPSFHEGLPIVALEAAHLDAPILLSDIPANRDIGLPAAHYFPVGDIDALADALTRPPTDFAVDGATVRSRFDWDEIARQTLAIYREAS